MKTMRTWLAVLILALLVSGEAGAETRGVRPPPATVEPVPVEIRVPVTPDLDPEVKDEDERDPDATGMVLSDAVSMAMENNPDIAMARTRADIARISYYITHDGGMAGPGWGGIELPPEFEWPEGWLTPERQGSMVRQAESSYRVATWAVDYTRSMVALQTEALFFGVLRLGRLVDVAEQAVEIAGRHLGLARAMHDIGLVARQDILEAELGVEEAKANLESVRGAQRLTAARFNQVLGRDIDTPVDLVDTLEDTPEPPPATELATLEQLAVAKRFEVRQAQEALDLRQREFDRMPEQLTSSLSYDLSRLQLTQAEMELEAERLKVRLEVRDAVRELNDAYERINSARLGKQVAGDQLRLAELRYEYGMGTGLELALARLSHSQATIGFIDSCYDYQIARSRLRVYTGARL